MEWDDLRYFLAVARSKSLRSAAQVLKTSPPTVGRRIADLERRLGARLFDRSRVGFALTENGEAIMAKAEDVEEAVLSVERAALGRDLRPSGKVRLTTIDDIASLVIAPRLSEFAARFPGIGLELVAQQTLTNLTRREADVALRTVRPEHGDYVVRQAGWWSLGLYVAKRHAKAHNIVPGRHDFARMKIITWTDEYMHLRGGAWFTEHAPRAEVALATNSRRIQYMACKAGAGVAILPSWIADKDSDLLCLLGPDKVMEVELWLAVHRDLLRTARVRAVVDFLTELCAKTLGRATGAPFAAAHMSVPGSRS